MSNATPEPGPTPTVVDLLLMLHDGDDRCGCLKEAFGIALERRDADDLEDVEKRVAWVLTYCLSAHPAGIAARDLGFPPAEVDD